MTQIDHGMLGLGQRAPCTWIYISIHTIMVSLQEANSRLRSRIGYSLQELNLPSKLGLRGDIRSGGDDDSGALPFDDEERVEEEGLELPPAKGLEYELELDEL